jgi:hypothetical protein
MLSLKDWNSLVQSLVDSGCTISAEVKVRLSAQIKSNRNKIQKLLFALFYLLSVFKRFLYQSETKVLSPFLKVLKFSFFPFDICTLNVNNGPTHIQSCMWVGPLLTFSVHFSLEFR